MSCLDEMTRAGFRTRRLRVLEVLGVLDVGDATEFDVPKREGSDTLSYPSP